MNSIIFNGKEFRQYPRNNNYFISKDGEVYSKFSKKIIKQLYREVKGKKYYYVDIYIEGKQRHMLVHRMLYESWVKLLDKGEQVNHIDDNSIHNELENLYCGDQKDNIKDCFKNEHRVGNVFYLTLYDKEIDKVLTFCPANQFIEYSGHSNKSGSLNKFFSKNWFKKRYKIIEFKKIQNKIELDGVTTIADECKQVN